MFSRKRPFASFRRKSASGGWRRKVRSRRGPYGYGPVGGTRMGVGGPSQAIVRNPRHSADRQFVKLAKTAHAVILTGAAGAYSAARSFPNDCHNPFNGNYGVTNPQAYEGFAAWAPGVYASYIVHAFAYEIEVMQLTGSSSCMVCASVSPATSAIPTSMVQQVSLPRAKAVMTGEGTVRKIKGYHTVAEVYGQTPQTVAIADSFAALYNAAPSSEVALAVGFADVGLSTQLTVQFRITLTAWVEVFGRGTNANS